MLAQRVMAASAVVTLPTMPPQPLSRPPPLLYPISARLMQSVTAPPCSSPTMPPRFALNSLLCTLYWPLFRVTRFTVPFSTVPNTPALPVSALGVQYKLSSLWPCPSNVAPLYLLMGLQRSALETLAATFSGVAPV